MVEALRSVGDERLRWVQFVHRPNSPFRFTTLPTRAAAIVFVLSVDLNKNEDVRLQKQLSELFTRYVSQCSSLEPIHSFHSSSPIVAVAPPPPLCVFLAMSDSSSAFDAVWVSRALKDATSRVAGMVKALAFRERGKINAWHVQPFDAAPVKSSSDLRNGILLGTNFIVRQLQANNSAKQKR